MTPTTDHTAGVIGITNLARTINPQIGLYQEHYINESFGFTVRLTGNGGIRVSREMAQDYETNPASISPEQIVSVAKSFWKF